MNLLPKPQKILSILLVVVILFAVNAPVFLQKTGALIIVDDPTEEEPEPPVTEPEPPVTEPEPPVTEPEPPVTDPPVTVPPVTQPPYVDPDPPTAAPAPVTQDNRQTTPSTTTAGQPAPTVPAETTTAAPQGIPSAIKKYNTVEEYFVDTQLDDKIVASTGKDQNAVHIGGGNVIINNGDLSHVSSTATGGENASHYGVGAVLLATNGTGFISKSVLTSEARFSSGAFAYGSAKLYMADTSVNTTMDTSHGLIAAETGEIYAWNMTVTTLGERSYPVFNSYGGSAIVLDGGSYTSSGLRSPAICCTDSISAANAEFVAEQSEAAVVRNDSTLTLTNVNLTGDQRISEDHPFQWTVLLYQPEKLDPAQTTNFFMKDGSLTSKGGGLFYTTNTKSNIYLENVTLKPYKNSDFLVRCTANADKVTWGEARQNGAVCNLTAVNQQLEGNVVWDRLSQISLYVKDGSVFTGAFVRDDTYKTGTGFADLYLAKDATWVVAGDTVLSHLYAAGAIQDTSGNTVTIKKADGTVILGGTSAYTIIVDAYQENADMNGAQKTPDWTKTAAVRPAALGASLAEITTVETTETSTTPAQPDAVYEKRKQLAMYVLIGVGVVAVAALGVWAYQANKYKLKKLFRK